MILDDYKQGRHPLCQAAWLWGEEKGRKLLEEHDITLYSKKKINFAH